MCVSGGGDGVGLLGCVCIRVYERACTLADGSRAFWVRVNNLFLVLRLEAGGISGIQGRPV